MSHPLELKAGDKSGVYKATLISLGLIVVIQYFFSTLANAPFNNQFYSRDILFLEYPFLSKRTAFLSFFSLLAVALLSILRPIKWRQVPRSLTTLILSCAVILSWVFGLYDYNYYLNNLHIYDRLAVLSLLLLTIYNPWALILFYIQVVIVSNQFTFPLNAYSFTDKKIVFDILISFWVFSVFKVSFWNKLPWKSFFLLALPIIMNWYLLAGLGKIELGWLTTNNLYYLFAASYDAGWMSYLPKSIPLVVGHYLYEFNWVIQLLALIVEVALPLFLLFNRSFFRLALIGFISFHFMVFFSSGIFFWKWILIEFVLLYISLKYSDGINWLFNWKYRISYFFILILSYFFYNSLKLSWFDCGYTHSFKIIVENSNNQSERLYSSYFAPFDITFSQGRFFYLVPDGTISKTYGTCDDKDLLGLVSQWKGDEMDLARLADYRVRSSNNTYNELKKGALLEFISEFLDSKNKSKWKSFFSSIDAPLHIHQGNNQQDLSLTDINEINLVLEEKIIKPGLQFDLIRRDTLRIK